MTESFQFQNKKSEGEDVQLFRVQMKNMFKKSVDSVSIEIFEEIYGDLLGRRKSLAKRLLKIWQDSVLEDMMKELDEVIIEEKLDEKLKMRRKIIEDCLEDKNSRAWRPPGNPTEHIRSLDMEEKLKRKKELQEFVKEKESEIQQLKTEVSLGRSAVLALENNLIKENDRLISLHETEQIRNNALESYYDKLTEEVLEKDDRNVDQA